MVGANSVSAPRARRASVEGRTVTTIKEMQEFCKAAAAQTHADPSAIRLHIPQDMRVTAVTLPDGHKVYDLRVSPAG